MAAPAYLHTLFEIKAVDRAQRVIEGWASTLTPDGGGDIMEPEGAQYKLPLPLLWQHADPIGEVFDAKVVNGKGIYIKARISTVPVPGRLQQFVDDAWASFAASPPLVRGLSVGWKPLEAVSVPNQKAGGPALRRVLKWLWLELSGVVVPMNSECTVCAIKSHDVGRAASGQAATRSMTPGVTGSPKAPAMKNYSEQITAAEAARDTKAARFDELITKDGTEGGLDADETAERTRLMGEIETANRQVKELQVLEAAMASRARVVLPATHAAAAAPIARAEVKELPKGTLFTRYAMAVAAGKGSLSDTLAYSKRWDAQTPEVSRYIKANAGSSIVESPGWGAELVYPTNLASEFAELLRPQTIIGRIAGFRMTPFNVRVPVQTTGSTVNWVGEKAAKPVTELDFTTVTLGYDKIAGIIVLTEELVRLSSPSAEATVRRDLTDQISQFMDEQFITPSVSATANNPASVTNAVTAVPASGTGLDDLFTDVNSALAKYDTAGMSTEDVHIVTTPALARSISGMRNALGLRDAQIGLTPTGGTLMGYPVVVSASVPTGDIVFVKPSEILIADDGRVTLDSSNQATLDMAGGNSPTFNLWQKNCVAIRAERWVTWMKRRSAAVQIITGAAYAPA